MPRSSISQVNYIPLITLFLAISLTFVQNNSQNFTTPGLVCRHTAIAREGDTCTIFTARYYITEDVLVSYNLYKLSKNTCVIVLETVYCVVLGDIPWKSAVPNWGAKGKQMVYQYQQMNNRSQRPHVIRSASLRLSVKTVWSLVCE
jgi:hypothetical protein